MALPTASDNVFPKVIESMQTTDTTVPSDSSWKIYAKANGIFARSSNAILGPLGWVVGTSMPTGPFTGQRVTRTDLSVRDYFYDGTRWRSVQVFTSKFVKRSDSATSAGDISTNISASGDGGRAIAPSVIGASDIYLLDCKAVFIVNSGGTALGASHKWVATMVGLDTNSASTGTVATLNVDSGSSAVYRTLSATINAVQVSGTLWYQVTWTKTGSPGTLNVGEEFSYQIIAT